MSIRTITTSSSYGDYFDILNKKQKNIIEKAIDRSLDPSFTGLIFNLPMGSGKTRISLITALALYNQTLIICSKTLLQNWIDEIKNVFGDSIKYEVYHKEYLKDYLKESLNITFEEWIPAPETRLILTTPFQIQSGYIKNNIKSRYIAKFNSKIRYQIPRSFRPYLRSPDRAFVGDSNETPPNSAVSTAFKGVDIFHSNKWEAVFIDEVQNYSNPETTTNQAICSMAIKHRYLLSGTPIVEPSIIRLLGLFLLLGISNLNTKYAVKKLIDSADWRGFKPYYLTMTPPKLKTEVIKTTIKYELNEAEIKIYKLFKSLITIWIEQFNKSSDDTGMLPKIRGHLLALITSMRISFIDPRKALNDLLIKIKDEKNDKDDNYLFILYPKVKKIESLLKNIDPVLTKTASTRLLELDKILKKKTTKQAIVFSSFIINLNRAVEYLRITESSRPIFMIDGKMNSIVRDTIIKDFKESTNGVLFATYSIGSEGLNLQTANTVVYLDQYWNQSKHDQTLGRIYRPGQIEEKIYEYDILTNLKFENFMLELQKHKYELSLQLINPTFKSKIDFKKPVLSIKDLADLIVSD